MSVYLQDASPNRRIIIIITVKSRRTDFIQITYFSYVKNEIYSYAFRIDVATQTSAMLPSLVSKARALLPQSSSSHLILQQATVNETIPFWGAADGTWTKACIPLSLVGGTAVLYKAVLDHPSSTSLSPVALVYLVLLASQYAFQPSLSQRFIAKSTVKTSLTLTEELIKATLAVVGLVLSCSSSSLA